LQDLDSLANRSSFDCAINDKGQVVGNTSIGTSGAEEAFRRPMMTMAHRCDHLRLRPARSKRPSWIARNKNGPETGGTDMKPRRGLRWVSLFCHWVNALAICRSCSHHPKEYPITEEGKLFTELDRSAQNSAPPVGRSVTGERIARARSDAQGRGDLPRSGRCEGMAACRLPPGHWTASTPRGRHLRHV